MNEVKKENDTKIIKLIAALAIDGMGMLSYLIPGVGEMFDAVWAPVSAILVYFMFGRKLSWAGFTFVEELAPFADVLPSATIAWFFYYYKSDNKK
jgi:hypothetical protein